MADAWIHGIDGAIKGIWWGWKFRSFWVHFVKLVMDRIWGGRKNYIFVKNTKFLERMQTFCMSERKSIEILFFIPIPPHHFFHLGIKNQEFLIGFA